MCLCCHLTNTHVECDEKNYLSDSSVSCCCLCDAICCSCLSAISTESQVITVARILVSVISMSHFPLQVIPARRCGLTLMHHMHTQLSHRCQCFSTHVSLSSLGNTGSEVDDADGDFEDHVESQQQQHQQQQHHQHSRKQVQPESNPETQQQRYRYVAFTVRILKICTDQFE